MKRPIKNFSNALLSLGMLVVMTACNDDDMPRPGFSKAEVKATATSNAGKTPIAIGEFTVDHFSVGIKDLDMMFLHHDAVEAGVTLENGTLKSNIDTPLGKSNASAKHLLLAAGGEILSSPVGSGETINGIYNDIHLKLNKITEAQGHEVALGKSLFLAGKVNGKSVHIWMENEDLISVPAKSSKGYEVAGSTIFMIKFNLDGILANVNFEQARDFDKDGIIQIGPNNADSNGSIYNVIKNNVAASVAFEEE